MIHQPVPAAQSPACRRAALCVVLASLAAGPAAAADTTDMEVSRVQVAGKPTEEAIEVKMLLPNAPEPEPRPLKVRDRLLLGTELIVPAKTVIDLHSPVDIGMALSPGSRFRASSPRMIEIRAGKAQFNVRKMLDFFNVEYEGFAALVRGTEFSVAVEPGQQVVCELSKGHLRVERAGRVKIAEGDRTAEVADVVTLDPRRNRRVVYSLKQDEYIRQFGTFAEAESYYRARLADAERGGNFDTLQGARNDLGSILVTIGRPQEAEPIFAAAAAAAAERRDLPWQARMLNNLGAAKLSERDYAGAVTATEAALAINLKLYPDGISKRIAHNYNNLGLAYAGLAAQPGTLQPRLQALQRKPGSPPLPKVNDVQAVGFFEKALQVNQALQPDGKSRAIAGNYGNLGGVYLRMGNTAEAVAYFGKALALLQALYPDERHPDLGKAYADLGAAELRAGDLAAGTRHLRLALSVRQALFPDRDHPAVAESLSAYGRALAASGLWTSGIRLQEEGLAMQRRLHPDGVHPALSAAFRNLADSWRDRGDAAKAEDFARQAEAAEARPGKTP